ncbi:dihydrodipicolinate synthase family protein [Fundicoccus culcitae]|uniref:Dihydrodipicolinate synthase family protein n=1 Tax=Fundicoccus culcitae TaxID=2969821 RepID=A0ABY5P8C0_9LACT|nr:dihydrodipicolinate synthase family protein [Fundicoccus culcitae]UUX34769.1 dihydrodipicolinate synthase family protein [Fundicoccus culcitae]
MIDKESIKGIIVPIISPVDDNEDLDEVRLRKIVNHVIEDGVHGILAFGSNSEFYMFEDEEMFRGIDIILEETAGRVPVYFGIGAIRTRKCIQLAKEAAKRDIAGISVLSPMFIKPTDEALFNHFKAIADAVPDTAMLLYNNPGRCGYNIPKEIIAKLAIEVPNILGIKDSSGDISFLSEIIRLTRETGFRVLSGKDTIIFPSLCMGAVGSVASTANMFGPLVNGIYNEFAAGNFEKARDLQYKLNPIRVSQDAASFPAATKDMANIMGLDVGKSIRPTEGSKGKILEKMEEEMRLAELID